MTLMDGKYWMLINNLGLRGYSYPSQTKMISVYFEAFEKYMMDKPIYKEAN